MKGRCRSFTKEVNSFVDEYWMVGQGWNVRVRVERIRIMTKITTIWKKSFIYYYHYHLYIIIIYILLSYNQYYHLPGWLDWGSPTWPGSLGKAKEQQVLICLRLRLRLRVCLCLYLMFDLCLCLYLCLFCFQMAVDVFLTDK